MFGEDVGVAIGGAAGCVNDASAVAFGGSHQDVERTIDVGVVACKRVVDRPRDGGDGGLVKDHVDVVCGVEAGVVVAHVAIDDFDTGRNVLEIGAFSGAEVIENADVVPLPDQTVDEMSADETCSAGHEIVGHDWWLLRPVGSSIRLARLTGRLTVRS